MLAKQEALLGSEQQSKGTQGKRSRGQVYRDGASFEVVSGQSSCLAHI